MELKDGVIILINLAILGTIVAAAVYIFQIGNKKRSLKCSTVDNFSLPDCSSWYAGPNGGIAAPVPNCSKSPCGDEWCRDQSSNECIGTYQCSYTGCTQCAKDAGGDCGPTGDFCQWNTLYDCSGEYTNLEALIDEFDFALKIGEGFVSKEFPLDIGDVGSKTDGFANLKCLPTLQPWVGTCATQIYITKLKIDTLTLSDGSDSADISRSSSWNQTLNEATFARTDGAPSVRITNFSFKDFQVRRPLDAIGETKGYFKGGKITIEIQNITMDGTCTMHMSKPSTACGISLGALCTAGTIATNPLGCVLCWGSSIDLTFSGGLLGTVTAILTVDGSIDEDGKMCLDPEYSIAWESPLTSKCSSKLNNDGTKRCAPKISLGNPSMKAGSDPEFHITGGNASILNALALIDDSYEADWAWDIWGHKAEDGAAGALGKIIFGSNSTNQGIIGDLLKDGPCVTSGTAVGDQLLLALFEQSCPTFDPPENAEDVDGQTCPSGQYIVNKDDTDVCKTQSDGSIDCAAGAVQSIDYYCLDCPTDMFSCGVGVADKFGKTDNCTENSSKWPTGCTLCPSGYKTKASGMAYCPPCADGDTSVQCS